MTASSPQKASSKRKPASKIVTKGTAKRSKKSKISSHPKFIDMIAEALQKLNEKSGSSRQAILKYIVSNYAVEQKLANQYLKVALKNGVKAGVLKQLKGIGASGSFKLADKAARSKRPAPTKPKAEAQTSQKKATGSKSPAKKPAKKKTVTKEAAAAQLPSAPKARKPPTVRDQVVAKKSRTKKPAAEKKAEPTPAAAETPAQVQKADSDKQVRVSARRAAEAKSKKAAVSTKGKKKHSQAAETVQA